MFLNSNEDKNECEIFPDENQSIRIKYGKTMRCGKKRKDSWIVLGKIVVLCREHRGEFSNASVRGRLLFWYLSLFVMC